MNLDDPSLAGFISPDCHLEYPVKAGYETKEEKSRHNQITDKDSITGSQNRGKGCGWHHFTGKLNYHGALILNRIEQAVQVADLKDRQQKCKYRGAEQITSV